MYPEELVAPMRVDLTSVGFSELKTGQDVWRYDGNDGQIERDPGKS